MKLKICRVTRSHLEDPCNLIRSFLDTLPLYSTSTNRDCPSHSC